MLKRKAWRNEGVRINPNRYKGMKLIKILWSKILDQRLKTSDRGKKKTPVTLVLGDWMINRLTSWQLSKSTKSTVIVRSFSGAHVRDMYHNMLSFLEESTKLVNIIMHVGTKFQWFVREISTSGCRQNCGPSSMYREQSPSFYYLPFWDDILTWRGWSSA